MKAILDQHHIATVAGIVDVFNYDQKSGEFLSKKGEYLAVGLGIPAHSCIDAPPPVKTGYVACRKGNQWEMLADHRGTTVYDLQTGSPVTISELGEFPATVTLLAPATEFDKWDGQQWVTDIAAQHAAAVTAAEFQQEALLNAAHTAITVLQARLALDRISDKEKALLNTWLDYLDALNAVDVTQAPNINWPNAPE